MEKTFEELIQDKLKSDDGFYRGFVPKDEIKELLQQVREATIKECQWIVNDYFEQTNHITSEYMDNLPTDRIKTDL